MAVTKPMIKKVYKIQGHSRFTLSALFTILIPFLFSLQSGLSIADDDKRSLPQDYFRSPLNLELLLSGNFGELRNNHFHSGLDIKTQAKSGYKVYSSAEGYVSRIRVSAGGYGNAVYVDHPNGYTTVYAHLLSFNKELESYVRSQQALNETFSIDINPPEGKLALEKGEILGLSGNSGSSSGPHLHFEIRDTESERALNPLRFGLKVQDKIAPKFFTLKVYAADINSVAVIEKGNGQLVVATYGNPAELGVTSSGDSYKLSNVTDFRATGRIGFGVEVKDYHNGSRSRLGVYQLDLVADGRTIYQHQMDSFHFDDLRFINAHVDYTDWLSRKKWVHRAHTLPGNEFDIYGLVNSNGYLNTRKGRMHEMSFLARDIEGNSSVVKWAVRGERAKVSLPPVTKSSNERMMYFDSQHSLVTDNFELQFPEGTFYDDFAMRIQERDKSKLSRELSLAPSNQAVHKYFKLWIKPDSPEALNEKSVIVHEDYRGTVRALSTRIENGRLYTRARGLGNFYISQDNSKPSIRALSVPRRKNYGNRSNIKFRIRDNLTGIRSFRGTIDGEWVLFEHDGKSAKITHTFSRDLKRGKHSIRIEVTDDVGNTGVYEGDFTR